MKYLYLTFLVLFCISCERDADIKLPTTPKRMAVNCYITPGDSIIAWVSEVKSIFGGNSTFDPGFIEDASVVVSDGNNSVTLTLDAVSREFYYSLAQDFEIQVGETYYLTVSAPGFPSLKSSCKVPLNSVSSFQVQYTMLPEGNDTTINAFFLWDDIAGEENYYRITASIIDTVEEMGVPLHNEYSFYFNHEMYNDNGSDGAKISSEKGQMFLEAGNAMSRHFKAYAITCDVHYYRYHLSLENYTGDNPFGEPSQLYTNVEGGLGVFGAYRKLTSVIRLF